MEQIKYGMIMVLIACGAFIAFLMLSKFMNMAFIYPSYRMLTSMLEKEADNPDQSPRNRREIKKAIDSIGQKMRESTFGFEQKKEGPFPAKSTTPKSAPLWKDCGKEMIIKQEGPLMNSPFARAKQCGTVTPGMKVIILEKRFTHYKIRTPDKQEGWITESLFEPIKKSN